MTDIRMEEFEAGGDNGEENGGDNLERSDGELDRGRLYTVEELMDKVAELEQRLKSRDEVIRTLKVEKGRVIAQKEKLEKTVQYLTPRMEELEARLIARDQEREERMNALLTDIYGAEGAVGGRITSTPKTRTPRKDWKGVPSDFHLGESILKKGKVGKTESKSEKVGEGALRKKRATERKPEEPEDKKKKKSSKNRRHERLLRSREGSRSKDSLYSSSKSEIVSDSDLEGTESEDESSINVRRSVLIREIPKIGRYRLYGAQDIVEFFRDFETYCSQKFGENKKFWVKELSEFLDDRLEGMYRAIVNVGDPRYEIVKERIIGQVRRIKGGVKYKKRNEFEEAHMEKGEKLENYAQRLESLARKKYGDDRINENKDLMRKFLATVPSHVRETVNARRKDKMRWANERLMWWDILEMIEDREIEDSRLDREVMTGRRGKESSKLHNSGSYRDAVMGDTVEVMTKFLEEYERGKERRGDDGWVYVGGNQDRNRIRRQERSNNQNVNWQGDRRNDRRNEVRCLRCGRAGHVRQDCAWARGACFGCGQVGHLLGACPNPRPIKCFGCGEMGHRRNECGRSASMNGRNNVCGNCGQPGHFARMCRVPRSTCTNCGKVGHVSAVCRRGVENITPEAMSVNPGNGV